MLPVVQHISVDKAASDLCPSHKHPHSQSLLPLCRITYLTVATYYKPQRQTPEEQPQAYKVQKFHAMLQQKQSPVMDI